MSRETVLIKESDEDRSERIRKLVGAEELLKILWTEACRPSLRWLREQQKRRTIPFVKVGHLVFFDPPTVAAKLAKNATVKAR